MKVKPVAVGVPMVGLLPLWIATSSSTSPDDHAAETLWVAAVAVIQVALVRYSATRVGAAI